VALADYQTLVDDLVRDEAGRVSTTQRDSAIALAVERYSDDRPRTLVEDLTGVSGTLLNLPVAWELDFSRLDSLEVPVGRVPPAILDQDSYAMYLAAAGLKIMLLNGLAAGSTVRATFTARHKLDASNDTLPLRHREATAKWAASMLCDQLAAFYATEQDTTISADRVMGQSKSQAYAARAKDYRKQYLDALGVADKVNGAAGVVVSLRPQDSHGQPYLNHPARRLL